MVAGLVLVNDPELTGQLLSLFAQGLPSPSFYTVSHIPHPPSQSAKETDKNDSKMRLVEHLRCLKGKTRNKIKCQSIREKKVYLRGMGECGSYLEIQI